MPHWITTNFLIYNIKRGSRTSNSQGNLFMLRRISTVILAVAALCALTHCESTDDNDVAEAQQCLNNLSDSAVYTDAIACEQKIAGVYTPESYVIRCSVDFFAAGITPTALLNAYQSSQNQSSGSSTAILMGALTQSTPGTTTPSLSTAEATYADCQSSGVTSLIFLAGISETGTAMAAGAGSSNPATFVATCTSNPGACNPVVVGTTAQTIAATYCQGSNSSSSQCTILNNAIASGNGNPTAIATALFNLLQ
jgi:hypothetical protein